MKYNNHHIYFYIKNKNEFSFLSFFLLIFISACSVQSSEDKLSYKFAESEIPFLVEVLPNTREILFVNDQIWESAGIYYFNVLKINENLWSMWYGSMENKIYSDYATHICYAYSINGKDWTKSILNNSNEKDNNILIHGKYDKKEGWVENFVFIDNNDKDYPYRIIYTALDSDGAEKTFMSKSSNGITWPIRRVVFNSKHDGQYSVHVQDDGNYMIFLRMWDSHHVNRQIGYAIITREGDIISPPVSILSGNLYNSAAFYLGFNNYIFFPTEYNSKNQKIAIKIGYIIQGKAGMTHQDITSLLFQNDYPGWGIVSPGLIPTGTDNEYWLYFYGRPNEHDDYGDPEHKTTYYRIKIIIKHKDHTNVIN